LLSYVYLQFDTITKISVVWSHCTRGH